MGDATPALPAPVELWAHLLDEADRARLESARFARRSGLGERPAVLVIDAQDYMVGPVDEDDDRTYPSSCGEAGRSALARIAQLLDAARAHHVPVFYTAFELAADGSDIGGYRRKRDLLEIDTWCLAGTPGARISRAVEPRAGDVVLIKKKPSAFFGTPLTAMLLDRGVDTVVVVGGSTSNCVRATAVDAASLNYRVVIPHECVFDRYRVSHLVSLFDLDRQYADVVATDDLVAALERY